MGLFCLYWLFWDSVWVKLICPLNDIQIPAHGLNSLLSGIPVSKTEVAWWEWGFFLYIREGVADGWVGTPTFPDFSGWKPYSVLYRLGQKEYKDTITILHLITVQKGCVCMCVCAVELWCSWGIALHVLICTICSLLLQHTLATSDCCLPPIWWLLTHMKKDTGKKGRSTFPKQETKHPLGLYKQQRKQHVKMGDPTWCF